MLEQFSTPKSIGNEDNSTRPQTALACLYKLIGVTLLTSQRERFAPTESTVRSKQFAFYTDIDGWVGWTG